MFPLKDDVPTNSTPFVTVGLIAINVLVFLYQVSLQGLASAEGSRAAQAFVLEFGLVPCRLTGHCVSPEGFPPPVVSMFTSMFLHGGLFHVAGNMLYLWIFGNNVEDTLGHARFVLFYLASGVGAALGQTGFGPESTVPMIGASGAVSGVLGAYGHSRRTTYWSSAGVRAALGGRLTPKPASSSTGTARPGRWSPAPKRP